MAKSKSRKRKGRRRSSSDYRAPQPARRSESRRAVEPAPKKSKREREREERPPAPWGSFPLQELSILVALVILIVGVVKASPKLVTVGVGLACLGGLELTLREHLAGYRSHTLLLAGVVFVVVVGGLFYYSGLILLICLIAGALAFVATALWLRAVFRRASGGLSFKIGGLRG